MEHRVGAVPDLRVQGHTGKSGGDKTEGGLGIDDREGALNRRDCRAYGNVLKRGQQKGTHGGSKKERDVILLGFGI